MLRTVSNLTSRLFGNVTTAGGRQATTAGSKPISEARLARFISNVRSASSKQCPDWNIFFGTAENKKQPMLPGLSHSVALYTSSKVVKEAAPTKPGGVQHWLLGAIRKSDTLTAAVQRKLKYSNATQISNKTLAKLYVRLKSAKPTEIANIIRSLDNKADDRIATQIKTWLETNASLGGILPARIGRVKQLQLSPVWRPNTPANANVCATRQNVAMVPPSQDEHIYDVPTALPTYGSTWRRTVPLAGSSQSHSSASPLMRTVGDNSEANANHPTLQSRTEVGLKSALRGATLDLKSERSVRSVRFEAKARTVEFYRHEPANAVATLP